VAGLNGDALVVVRSDGPSLIIKDRRRRWSRFSVRHFFFFSRFHFFRELSLAFGERAQTIRRFGDEFAHGQPLQPGFRDCLYTIESARQLAKHGGGGVGIVA
jgi:hypothetical protein